MSIIFFENQKINELQNLLRDINCNIFATSKTAFENSITAMKPELNSIGNISQLINDINSEFNFIEEAFHNNLSFLEILDDKYSDVERVNRLALEELMAGLAFFEEKEETGEVIPDVAVTINRTLRYLLDNLVEGFEDNVKPISLKDYTFRHSGGYFVSGASDKNIISKYLTKLDFSFLSSLSQVYDFFDFSDINLLTLNQMSYTDKLSSAKLSDEALHNILEQKRRFPALHEVMPDPAENQLRNISTNIAKSSMKDIIEESLFTDETFSLADSIELMDNLKTKNSIESLNPINADTFAEEIYGINTSSEEKADINIFGNTILTATAVINMVAQNQKAHSDEDEPDNKNQANGNQEPAYKKKSEENNQNENDHINLNNKIEASYVMTDKLEIKADSIIRGDTASSRMTAYKENIISNGDIELDDIAAVTRITAQKESTTPNSNTELDDIAAAARLETQKENVTPDSNIEIDSVSAATYVITQKENTTPDGNTEMDNIAITVRTTTQKESTTPDSNTELDDIAATARLETQKENVMPDNNIEIDNVSAATHVISQKENIASDGNTELDNIAEAIRATTQKESTTPDSNTVLDNISTATRIPTQKENITPDGNTELDNITVTVRTATEKQSIVSDGNVALSNIAATEKIITEKTDVNLSGNTINDELELVDVKHSSLFRHLNDSNKPVRTFRLINKFNFVEDESEDKTGYIKIRKVHKTVKETIKDDENPKNIQSILTSAAARTITPHEFIEGIADEFQLMEVAIRKQLNWEEIDFHMFMDFLYSLPYTTEFPSTPMMIAAVYAAIINYIVRKSFQITEKVNIVTVDGIFTYGGKSEGAIYHSEAIQSAAAEIILRNVKNPDIAKALVGMKYPKSNISPNDIFANENEIFNDSRKRFELLSGDSFSAKYDEFILPEPISAHIGNSRYELLEQRIQGIALQKAADSVVSSFVGIEPSRRVTINSAIPAFTTFEKPREMNQVQSSEFESRSNMKNQPGKSKKSGVVSPGNSDSLDYFNKTNYNDNSVRQNAAEGFDVEYTQGNNDFSKYLIDAAGGGTAGFFGGLLLSGDEDLDGKFMRVSKLPVHTYEEVIKNAYQCGIIKQAKNIADAGDIFRALSGGKATVTVLNNIESCLT